MVAGAVSDVAAEHQKKVNLAYVVVVAELAYFLADELNVEADRLAVFDLTTEWKLATLRALTRASMDNEEEDESSSCHPIVLLFFFVGNIVSWPGWARAW
jgi:hypothetical protein